ncbi:MAG: nucleoside transporter C-terminal domain-containing protein, partial [Candidatus Dependentiae bacterium]
MLTSALGVSVLGITVILGVATLFSTKRDHIKWDVVAKGFLLQLALAYGILRTETGKYIFECLASGFSTVYAFADKGSEFVFGPLSNPDLTWSWPIFAVKVIPIIIFFGALTSLLFHLRVVQWLVSGISHVVRPLLGTTGPETLCATANSMLGQTEAPLLIKNYLKVMTESEMLVVMISGFATLSGALLAVYGSMGVSMHHLLTASVMAIPGSLVVAKILIPETAKSKTGDAEVCMEPETENVLDAISTGTSDGLNLAANVAAMLIAFISLIALLNYLLQLGTGYILPTPIDLEFIFGKLFAGVAWLMGIGYGELESAGALLGTKLVVNEFVAYSNMKAAMLSARTQNLLTYALCGFSNFSCIGIQIGGIGALVPSKRSQLTRLGMRALL